MNVGRWQRWLPILVSVAAAAGLILAVDLAEFRNLLAGFDWSLVPEAALALVVVVLFFGWRWQLLLGRQHPLRAAMVASAVGLACNQVLPARGGDLLRAAFSARWGRGSFYEAISALVIEKLIDLVAVGAIGLLALLIVFDSRRGAGGANTGLLLAGALIPAALVLLLLARTGTLRRLAGVLARWMGVPPGLYRHAYRPLFYLERASRARALIGPAALTALMWLGPYTYVFHVLPQLVGLGVGWTESMVLLFATAIGLAVPAAPSGIGTVHAAVVAGYVMIGRTATEGLVAGTLVHGAFLVVFGAVGLVAILFAPTPPKRSLQEGGQA